MRDAMMAADVGDDVYGEDPSVNALERKAADLVSMEAAVFVASGTQSNLIALLTHCARGDEYIAGGDAHTYRFEAGGGAVLGGIQPQPVPFRADGTLDPDTVRAVIKPDDPHFARTRLICLENTQGGKVAGPAYHQTMRDVADAHGLRLHLDGARLFNAAVALGEPVRAFTNCVHSVSICLSKGLGAPVGSVLCGSERFVAQARRNRKLVGGGMRQAGFLAAAGAYALDHHVERLATDHSHAATLAAALNRRFSERRGAGDAPASTAHTNMLFLGEALDDVTVDKLATYLRSHDVLAPGRRWVCHLDVAGDDIDRVVGLIEEYED